MAGYTPVFSSVLDGTLFGKWPHTGVWLCLLSQCDLHGHIDAVPKLLAAKIGVSEEILLQCIADFTEPDPGSRTGDLDGRRLELIDPTNRNWGWRVINHGIYREKARKSAYDAERTRSGKDAERKQAERERNAGKDAVPRSPDASRRGPLSDSDSDSDSNKDKDKTKALQARDAPPGLNPDAWKAWTEYRASMKKIIRAASAAIAMKQLAAFGSAQMAVVEQSIGNGWTGLFQLKTAHGSSKHKASNHTAEWAELEAKAKALGLPGRLPTDTVDSYRTDLMLAERPKRAVPQSITDLANKMRVTQ